VLWRARKANRRPLPVEALQLRADGATPKAYVAVNDGFGNVVGLIDGQNGELAAEYEYSPFGELLRAAGPVAAQNPIRCASKYFDSEGGLVSFGFRYYSPSLGRFINRDPKGDPGWANLLSCLNGRASPSWSYIGKVLRNVHEKRYGGKESTLAHSTESGSDVKNSADTAAPIADRKAHVSSLAGSGSGSDDAAPEVANWSHAYAYLGNNPLNDVEYLGLWSVSEWWSKNITGYGGLLGFNGPIDRFQSWTYSASEPLFALPGLNMVRSGLEWGFQEDLFTGKYTSRDMAFERFWNSTLETSLFAGLGAAGTFGRAAAASRATFGWETAGSGLSPLSLGARSAFEGVFEWAGSRPIAAQPGIRLGMMQYVERTFMTPVGYAGVGSRTSWAGQGLQRIAPEFQWQQAHVFLQRRWWDAGGATQWYANNPAAQLGMMRLGNAGWNLMPIPARMNNYLGRHPWAAFGFGIGVAGGGTGFVGGAGYLGYSVGDWLFDE
jgi:RHS repeat-associated protein